MTYTYAWVVTEKSQNVYGVYLDMNDVATDSIIRLPYEVNVPITTFNIFARIRYLPCFLESWYLKLLLLWTSWSERLLIIIVSQLSFGPAYVVNPHFNFTMWIAQPIFLISSTDIF
jgi:hypothetical protein